MQVRARHDQIAFDRQRYLAQFMLVTDGLVLIVSGVTALLAHWRPMTSDRWWLIITAAIPTCVLLLIAADVVGGCRDMWHSVTSAAPNPEGHRDRGFFAEQRMIFFYLGVNLNILTIAILIEQTGGVTTSPYVVFLFSFVLTGQQLSRFKTQSTLLIVMGAAVVLAMFAYEGLHGVLPTPAPPRSLTLLMMAGAFTVCGLITNREKDHNYLLEGEQGLPTHARIYKDVNNLWHYVIYRRHFRLDPVVGQERLATSGSDSSLAAIKGEVERNVKSMYQAAGWGQPKFIWSQSQKDDLLVQFPANDAGLTAKTNPGDLSAQASA